MNNFDEKTTITFDEYKAWMSGLLSSKQGDLPSIEDWKQIEIMMNKVTPEVINFPLQPYYIPPIPYNSGRPPDYYRTNNTCSTSPDAYSTTTTYTTDNDFEFNIGTNVGYK